MGAGGRRLGTVGLAGGDTRRHRSPPGGSGARAAVAAARGERGRVWPSRGKGLEVSSLQSGGGGGVRHSVLGALAPPSLFQFGSGAWQVQQSISAAVLGAPRCPPPPPSRARLPNFWRLRLPAPPPSPPRPLRAPHAGCALRVLPPLLPLPASPLAPSLAASSQPRPSCSLQSAPGLLALQGAGRHDSS